MNFGLILNEKIISKNKVIKNNTKIINDGIMSKLYEYNEALKDAIKTFIAFTNIDFKIPKNASDFNINLFLTKKNELIDDLRKDLPNKEVEEKIYQINLKYQKVSNILQKIEKILIK